MDNRNRFIVDAVLVEGRSVSEVADDFEVSCRWVHKLVKRFSEGGYQGLEPRSRRPLNSPSKISDRVVKRILKQREKLLSSGFDCGPVTIRYHLIKKYDESPSVSSIHRV